MTAITQTTDLEKISAGLTAFDNRKADLEALAESAKGIDIINPEDKAALRKVSDKRKELKAARVQVEKEGKAMRDLITPITKHISSREKELVAIVSVQEDYLASREQWANDEIERVRAEKEGQEKARIQKRIDQFAAVGVAIDYVQMIGMTEEQFNDRLNQATADYEAEQARIEAERKAEEEAKAAEAERMRLEREELERLRADQERREAEMKAAQEKIDAERRAIDAEKQRMEDERQAAIEAEARAEREKEQAKQREIEIEKAKKESAERAIIEQKEKEEKERIAAEKKAARQPDKAKLEQFAASLSALPLPEMKTVECRQIMAQTQIFINNAVAFITDKAKQL